ncbi:branched-chain amino acid transport system ATP-binding protein [Bosea sp. BE125]|uniref:ABC transporter ATP-binding protein n=1 Tax=Bosea sp. BE125 TaxID=2817909 RepID=UPI002857D665|nr:ABC transporter ATP-binding protein [Bosea sp. BE125]MDR6869611.1 branched-chain amino acid transport system ATP-binding protein [Bosea sp. BE125]
MTAALTIAGLKLDFYGVHVLRGVDFAVPAGSFTGLIGPNGAGKSTLFNAVSGLYRPKAGSVRLGSVETTGLPPERLVAAGLVRSFQLARGFPKLSVFQHLMLYGARQPGENLLAAMLPSAAARRREQELTERAFGIARRLKLDHVLDNPVTALSGGQKKLVEIGRALMADPKILLLDEPMAGVNPSLTEQIADHLIALNRDGLTICLIEHDMALIKRLCAPVIVMAEGKTLTQGSFDEVASDIRVQEAYLGRRH